MSKIAVEDDLRCAADLAVFSRDGQKQLLYVGQGDLIENEDFQIQCVDAAKGNVSVEYSSDKLQIKSDVKVLVKVKKRSLRKRFKLSSEFEVVGSLVK